MASEAKPESQQGETPALPAAVANVKDGVSDDLNRGEMSRTISMDIREEREDLKRAAEQSVNAILELALEGHVKWVSSSWQDISGTPGSELLGKHISEIIVDDEDVFAKCVQAMQKDDSQSRVIRFSVKGPGQHDGQSQTGTESGEPTPRVSSVSGHTQNTEHDVQSLEKLPSGEQENIIHLEAQGIMVYDRDTGEESHTMWMIKPAITRQITIDLPDLLVESLGIGAEMLAHYLTLLSDVGVNDPETHPPPMPVLCRICERRITPWMFEKHTELCAQDHRAEMEVQMAQESLNEQRSSLVKVLDALESQVRASKSASDSGSHTPWSNAEYKGHPIGSNSMPSSGPSSGRSSPSMHVPRSRDSSSSGLGHRRARSFAVRRPLARIVELVLDLCDTAMEISTPDVKDSRAAAQGDVRTLSPQSEGRIQQVLQWQSPSANALENEQGLALLCDDTSHIARAKVEAVFRHRRIIEYSERIRMEYEMLVAECIDTAVEKAKQIRAGELSDSGESSEGSSDYRTPEQQMEPQEDTLKVPLEAYAEETSVSYNENLSRGPSALSRALRSASEFSVNRRASSTGSSRTSSPHGVATPRSYAGLSELSRFSKRGSIAFESDAGFESDGSVHSSVASTSTRRVESPNAEVPLSRVASHRSRERKRHSLILPSLVAASSNRQPSPGRLPPGPGSPLRVKPRIPSGAMSATDSVPSPITSPTLSHSDFPSPIVRAQHKHHHRRQSSVALLEALGRPASPHLNAPLNAPQARAPQTSIRDFEIIKPISKGAFGSVYLSKKRSTGDYFAIKVLKKADMVAKNQVTNVKAERAIMMWQSESDFVAKLYWTFSSKENLYLVMEYLNGGDCASLIKVLGELPEDWTKKYIGEVVLCVEHLHNRQIVHRDLKPDNFLIDVKGHLKLTDFGLSRMGLIGRQKRAMNAKPDDAPPDLLHAGPFKTAPSVASSRSTSFDFQAASQSPAQTPSMYPALGNELGQPSYFALTRENSVSREQSRRPSGRDSGDSDSLSNMLRRFSMIESRTPIEEESHNEVHGSNSPDFYALQPVTSNSSAPRIATPPQAAMPPPQMALFDPEDNNRRFVGTPDYLAPETINGAGQDEMSDWWSLGCILFECLYGRPPFNADTPDEVFNNILTRNIQWPDSEDHEVSEEAKDLMNRLMCLDPKDRLGSNKDEKYPSGGDEIKAHPWFEGVSWDTLREDEASFIPLSENPEDTEYFDARGATMENFAAEFEDQQSSPAQTPGADYPDRPHDALSRVRNQINNAAKRNLMPLHIPPHVRDARSRRLSEPVVADDFGNFQFKNLPVLEKANKDVIQKLRADAMHAQAKSAAGGNSSAAAVSSSPGPSLDSSPMLPMPLKRTLSANKSGNRPQSPSLLSQTDSSPSRGSHPTSPLLVQFSAGQNHERRKTSSGSSNLSQQTSNTSTNQNTLQPGSFFEQAPRLPNLYKAVSNAASPVKGPKAGSVHVPPGQSQTSSSSPRQRSFTVGSQEGDLVPELIPAHYKRRSGIFDVSPSSSDTEETRQKALLRVQRRRASSRRLSQITLGDGPSFRTLDVLVCEDHPVSRLVMERLLEKLRCRTISVTSGPEAMRYASSEVKFDIIMMEYKLPQLNGADVVRMIRDTKNANSHTPIVAVTGYLKELSGPHHFDALVEKPPTKEKLEEVMRRLCQWRPAPDDWVPPAAPPIISRTQVRQDSGPTDDSPSTTTSSGVGGDGIAFSSNSVSSSRGDSIGSSQLSSTSEIDGQYDSIPVIISRQATADWEQSDLERNFGGLGISNSVPTAAKEFKIAPRVPSLVSQTSAPASLAAPESPVPRRQPSIEAIEAKRRSFEKDRHESPAESGDDEDEELGNIQVRARSPKRNIKRSSRLGIEMMRTNSQGSVVSTEDMVISREAERAAVEPSSPSDRTIAEESAAEVEAAGHLTPPVIFPRGTGGGHAEVIDMDRDGREVDDADATPRPQHLPDSDPDPTPKGGSTPAHP